ncbi:CoA transferase subunit A [Thermopolyspora sp. NPDC052614]|uniref:CoA transferase subunit A n=1 Tax=Thermopolyspora sp. NPDC052614 TaxID=3155682 RepID=UPI00344A9D8A
MNGTGKIRDSVVGPLREVLTDGATIMVGGFGLSGSPFGLIEAVHESGVGNLTVIANNVGTNGKGLGLLVESGQVVKMIASYVGENTAVARRYLAGELDIEFVPQGTLAERMRAGGAGIAGFYTRTGVGTVVAEGKPHAEFDGETYILERGIVADIALVKAHRADPAGNLVYRKTARNFNPLVATAGRVTFAEVDRCEPEYLDPDIVGTPGIFVDYVVQAAPRPPEIEYRTVRVRPIQERSA